MMMITRKKGSVHSKLYIGQFVEQYYILYMHFALLSSFLRGLVECDSHSDGTRSRVALPVHLNWHADHGGWLVV